MAVFHYQEIVLYLCAFYAIKHYQTNQWNLLSIRNIRQKSIATKKKFNFLWNSKRKIFENTIIATTSEWDDDGLRAFCNISLLIAKSRKPHTIGEELILPAVNEVICTVLYKPAFDVLKRIPLSNNIVQRRIDEMAQCVKISLYKSNNWIPYTALQVNFARKWNFTFSLCEICERRKNFQRIVIRQIFGNLIWKVKQYLMNSTTYSM